LLINGLKTALL